ncbi:UNVERIFIED_CONTAM: hypothetical protein Sradi_2612600 [Sesamum radiatum]|uniref:Rab-GAP TBC domain-containing protein n=1 Tax=Sesamum radiatum TaxID=300843 RepID=A0AAW2S4N6_SESRA
MVGVGGSDWNHYVGRKPHVVKRRIRKGIPDCLRGLVWQLISGSRELLLMNPGVYEGAIIIFKVGLAVLKYCHDDLIKLPFEKLIYALRNFPADAMNPDMLLPMAYSLKVSKSLDESKEEYAKQNKNLPDGVTPKLQPS